MTRRRWTLKVYAERLYTGASGWRSKEVLESSGHAPRWDAERRCWYLFGRKPAADGLVALEQCRAALLIEGRVGDEQDQTVDADDDRESVDPDVQLTLFDGPGDAA